MGIRGRRLLAGEAEVADIGHAVAFSPAVGATDIGHAVPPAGSKDIWGPKDIGASSTAAGRGDKLAIPEYPVTLAAAHGDIGTCCTACGDPRDRPPTAKSRDMGAKGEAGIEAGPQAAEGGVRMCCGDQEAGSGDGH